VTDCALLDGQKMSTEKVMARFGTTGTCHKTAQYPVSAFVLYRYETRNDVLP
jgi:hypothetical protein